MATDKNPDAFEQTSSSNSRFSPPSTRAINFIVSVDLAYDRYTDWLLGLHDLICRFSSTYGPPRFEEKQALDLVLHARTALDDKHVWSEAFLRSWYGPNPDMMKAAISELVSHVVQNTETGIALFNRLSKVTQRSGKNEANYYSTEFLIGLSTAQQAIRNHSDPIDKAKALAELE
jgi:hypothetical protein